MDGSTSCDTHPAGCDGDHLAPDELEAAAREATNEKIRAEGAAAAAKLGVTEEFNAAMDRVDELEAEVLRLRKVLAHIWGIADAIQERLQPADVEYAFALGKISAIANAEIQDDEPDDD